jgi:hypothetical protein
MELVNDEAFSALKHPYQNIALQKSEHDHGNFQDKNRGLTLWPCKYIYLSYCERILALSYTKNQYTYFVKRDGFSLQRKANRNASPQP